MSDIMATDIHPDYQFCLDLICDSGYSDPIIEMISPALASHTSFSLDGAHHLKALVQALHYAQKKPKMETDNKNIGVTKLLALNMRESHDEFEALDNAIFEKLDKLR